MTKLALFDRIRAYKMGEINWSDCKAAVDAYSSASNNGKPHVSGALPDDSELEDWLFDGYERNSKNLERLKIGKVVRDRIAQKLNSDNDR